MFKKWLLLVGILLGVWGILSAQGGNGNGNGNTSYDLEFIGFSAPDIVTLHQEFTISGFLRNNGPGAIPANIVMGFRMENENNSSGQSGNPNFTKPSNSPVILPGETVYYEERLTTSPDHFDPGSTSMVIVWPVTATQLTDIDDSNNIYTKSLYVSDVNQAMASSNPTGPVSVYPNPVVHHLDVVLNTGSYSKVFLMDAMGKVVQQKDIISSKTNYNFNVNYLSNGVYYIYLKGTNGSPSVLHKLIK